MLGRPRPPAGTCPWLRGHHRPRPRHQSRPRVASAPDPLSMLQRPAESICQTHERRLTVGGAGPLPRLQTLLTNPRNPGPARGPQTEPGLGAAVYRRLRIKPARHGERGAPPSRPRRCCGTACVQGCAPSRRMYGAWWRRATAGCDPKLPRCSPCPCPGQGQHRQDRGSLPACRRGLKVGGDRRYAALVSAGGGGEGGEQSQRAQ
jgi:hypothetical protein